MIQPNELRMGNWVDVLPFEVKSPDCDPAVYVSPTRISGGKSKINGIWESIVFAGGFPICDFSVINPIPLTEEILLKCGFEKEYHGFRCEDLELSHGRYLMGFPADDNLYVSVGSAEYGFSQAVNHLHQLQNIYFALTGKELKVDL